MSRLADAVDKGVGGALCEALYGGALTIPRQKAARIWCGGKCKAITLHGYLDSVHPNTAAGRRDKSSREHRYICVPCGAIRRYGLEAA